MFLLALFALVSTPSWAQVRYYYDELDRLIEAVAPDGQSVQYTYDAAGNITDIKKLAATALSIAEFTPNAGPVGTVVTLYGSGFNATAASNTVKFNGTTAVVSAATATSLTVAVPTGATSGVITVSNANGTATSSSAFVVGVTMPAPTLTNFTPNIGNAGTVVTLAGSNFQLNPEDNKVTFGTVGAVVVKDASSPTATLLKVLVPHGTASGKISVTTPYGKATTATEFYAVPNGVNAADVEFKGRLAVNGAPLTITTTAPGKKALVLFEGSAAQMLHFVSTSGSFAQDVNVVAYAPDGRTVQSFAAGNAKVFDFTEALPGGMASTTYTLVLSPAATDKGSMTFTLVDDASGSLTVDGSGTAISLVSGRNARYTFTADAGKGYGLALTGLSFSPAAGGYLYVRLKALDGTLLVGCNFTVSNSCNLHPKHFVTAGVYQIEFDSYAANATAFTAILSKDVVGPLTIDAATPTTAILALAGQNARYTFSGTAGQSISLVLTGNTLDDGNSATTRTNYATLYKPSNADSYIAYAGVATGTANGSVDVTLPETGTYTVFVDPEGLDKGSVGVQVKSYLTGALAVDGANAAITLTTGRNAQYSFTAEAGQGYGVAITGLATTPASGSLYVRLRSPAGVELDYCTLNTDGSCNFPPRYFTAAGTYSFVFDPYGASAASFTAAVSKDVTGALTVDAATPTTATIARAGQNARYTFSGNAGQSVSVVLSGSTLDDGNASTSNTTRIYAYKPSNTNNYFDNVSLSAGVPNASLDLQLPETGTYTLWIDPDGLDKGNLGLQVKSYLTGTLTVDGAASAINLSSGRNAEYTISAQAGKGYGLAVSGLTFSPVATGTLYAYLKKPDGTSLTSCSFNSSNSCDFAPSYFTTAGSYRIVFDPYGANAAAFSAVISQDASGTLAVNAAAPTIVPIARAGQNGLYTFSGTAGQSLHLLLTGNTLDDGNTATSQTTYVYVYKPDGGQLISWSQSTSTRPGDVLPLLNLPATGTYTLFVDPNGLDMGQISLLLKTSGSGPALATTGTPTAVAVGAQGLGYYSFTGEAGKAYTLAVSGLSIAPGTTNASVDVELYAPNGSNTGKTCAFSASTLTCDIAASYVVTTGSYSLVVLPRFPNAASLNLSLTKKP